MAYMALHMWAQRSQVVEKALLEAELVAERRMTAHMPACMSVCMLPDHNLTPLNRFARKKTGERPVELSRNLPANGWAVIRARAACDSLNTRRFTRRHAWFHACCHLLNLKITHPANAFFASVAHVPIKDFYATAPVIYVLGIETSGDHGLHARIAFCVIRHRPTLISTFKFSLQASSNLRQVTIVETRQCENTTPHRPFQKQLHRLCSAAALTAQEFNVDPKQSKLDNLDDDEIEALRLEISTTRSSLLKTYTSKKYVITDNAKTCTYNEATIPFFFVVQPSLQKFVGLRSRKSKKHTINRHRMVHRPNTPTHSLTHQGSECASILKATRAFTSIALDIVSHGDGIGLRLLDQPVPLLNSKRQNLDESSDKTNVAGTEKDVSHTYVGQKNVDIMFKNESASRSGSLKHRYTWGLMMWALIEGH
ncbi:hypothetical protein NECAME_07197, partial [Necator americanus]